MAEFVELRLEEMLPEFEEVRRLKLMTGRELKLMIKRRRELEYKIQKRTKDKDDYLRYIRYEMQTLALLDIRRNNRGCHFKKHEIEYAIARRINLLFKKMIMRFQGNVNLWLHHIKFCQQLNWKNVVSRIYVRMLQVHGDKPELWIRAARWEKDENSSIEDARGLLLRGLRFHPQSKDLYLEAFRLEMCYMEMLLKRRDVLGINEMSAKKQQPEGSDPITEGTLAYLMYAEAVKKIPEPKFFMEFVIEARKFRFDSSVTLQGKIVADLEERFPNSAIMWDMKARLAFEAEEAAEEPPAEDFLKMDVVKFDSETNHGTFHQRLQKCCSIFKEGLKKVDNPQEMWSLHISTLQEVVQKAEDNYIGTSVKCVLDHLQEGHEAFMLEAPHYLYWERTLRALGRVKECCDVMKYAVECYPADHQLWKVRMNCLFGWSACGHVSQDAVLGEFRGALRTLGDSSETLELWKLVAAWLLSRGSIALPALYEEALQRKPVIAAPMKCDYLTWINRNKGIKKAREFYEKQCTKPPLSCDLHLRMATIECCLIPVDANRVRKCYEMAVDHFGANRTDIWIDYAVFEKDFGDPSLMSHVHWKAMKQLDPDLSDQFQTEYALNKTA